jgi:hypothetical protein
MFRISFERAAGTVLVLVLVGSLLACGSTPKTPSLPSTQMHNVASKRLGLVDLAVDDSDRAKKVRELYAQIDTLALEFTKQRQLHIDTLIRLSEPRELPEGEVRAELWKLCALGKQTFPKYVELQIELRKRLTADEFAKLNKVH